MNKSVNKNIKFNKINFYIISGVDIGILNDEKLLVINFV